MNAKKIMGAVLVALLAAALFVGAGAAADIEIGPVTTYTDLTNFQIKVSGDDVKPFAAGQTFFAADGTPLSMISDGSKIYFAAEGEALNKKYTGYGYAFTLVAPTSSVAALDENGVNMIGQTVSKPVADKLIFTYTFAGTTYSTATGATNAATLVYIDEDGVKYTFVPTSGFSAGKWGVAVDFSNMGLVPKAPVYGQVYYFTVAKTEASITAVADTVNKGETIVLEIQYPGQKYAAVTFDSDYVGYIKSQAGVKYNDGDNYVNVTLDMYGAASVAFEAKDKGKAKFTLGYFGKNGAVKAAPGNPKVTVDIKMGEITAVADEDSYFTGNAIKLSGTTTAGSDLFFYIEGTNYPLTQVNGEAGVIAKSNYAYFAADGDLEIENGAWTVALDPIAINDASTKKLIAGTYTVIVSTYDYGAKGPVKDTDGSAMTMKESIMDNVYGVAGVTLTQPFIENVKADAVAIQELEYKITGTAYSAENINVYVFGTNYFYAAPAVVDIDEETFEFTLKGGQTKGMDVGTYFYLIQHPMGDKFFNVWNGNVTGIEAAEGPKNVKNADFYYAATSTPLVKDATFIFNAYERGTNYAAQALLEEIAGQNIDDVFVQGTFKVEAQKLTINPIPAQVAKGSALTVSGTSNCGEGTEVIVNVYEGTFGATIKGDENAATFLTNKAVTKADGTWEAAIDTSKLKLGTYTVTVELNGQQFDSEAVEIVDAAPVTPVDPVDPVDPKPVDPVTPTEPETPGFGALAALAGLGAVAVLLLRRE